jgi:hypothetical protein
MRSGMCYPHAPWVHHTHVSGCSLWPTPTARDWKDSGNFTIRERSQGPSLPMAVGGPLNPTWVEALMGFPLGWTELD